MAMKKIADGEGKIQVLRGAEAQVLNEHQAKTGKYAISDFSDDEVKAFEKDLANAAEKADESISK